MEGNLSTSDIKYEKNSQLLLTDPEIIIKVDKEEKKKYIRKYLNSSSDLSLSSFESAFNSSLDIYAPPSVFLNNIVSTRDLQPILGEPVRNGIKPLFNRQHQGTDAVFALACKYPKVYYQRFVGSLRKFNFNGDIVLAVSPPDQMKPGVKNYLIKTKVIAYGFEVDCAGKDNCKLKDEFLG